MCPNTGKACRCQPQEGVMCPSGPTPNDWQGLNMEAERAALCENCRTITTCLEMGCGQGGSTRRVASVVGDDGLPPLPEPDGEADVPVDAERAVFTAVDAWSESLVRQAQRDAIAPYAERIRVLEREAEEMRVSIDQARGICDAVAEALGDDLDREAGSEESIRRLRRAQRPTQSIDTPEFRKLIDRYHDEIDSYKYEYRDSNPHRLHRRSHRWVSARWLEARARGSDERNGLRRRAQSG